MIHLTHDRRKIKTIGFFFLRTIMLFVHPHGKYQYTIIDRNIYGEQQLDNCLSFNVFIHTLGRYILIALLQCETEDQKFSM
jgi:hypothetical protein